MKGTAVSLLGIDEGTFDVAVIKDAPSHLLGQHKQLAGAYFGSYLCKADDADDGIVVRAFGGAGPGASTQAKKHVTKALAYALCLALHTSFRLRGHAHIPAWLVTEMKSLKTYLPEAFAEALDSHPAAPNEIWEEDDVADAAETTIEGNVNREVGDKGKQGRAGSLPRSSWESDKGRQGRAGKAMSSRESAETTIEGKLTAASGKKLKFKPLKPGKKAEEKLKSVKSGNKSEDVAGGPAASGRRLDDKRESMDVARSHGCRMDVDKDVDMDVRFPTEAAYHAFSPSEKDCGRRQNPSQLKGRACGRSGMSGRRQQKGRASCGRRQNPSQLKGSMSELRGSFTSGMSGRRQFKGRASFTSGVTSDELPDFALLPGLPSLTQAPAPSAADAADAGLLCAHPRARAAAHDRARP